MWKKWKQWDYFHGFKITAHSDCSHEIKRCLLLGRKTMTNIDSILKSRDVTLPAKVGIVNAIVFPVVMYRKWEFDHKEGWMLKNWCFWTVVLERTLGSPLDCKEIQPVNPKGNQPGIFIGRTDAEAPPDTKNWLIWKDPDAGKDWRQEEKGRQRMRCLENIINSMDMCLVDSGRWWETGRPGMLQSMGS